jgi:hypothetical protein
MYKLFDGNACLPGCFAKAATAVTIEVNRNGHYCTPKLLGCRSSLRTLGVFSEVPQNLSCNVTGI